MAKRFRPSWEFSDTLIRALATRLGVDELTTFSNEEVQQLHKNDQAQVKAKVRDLVFTALEMVANNTAAPIPANAYALNETDKFEFFTELSKRTVAAKDEVRAPAEVLAERFHSDVGKPIWLTENQLVQEALKVFHERGMKTKTLRDVIREAIHSRCQSIISKYLQFQYGAPSSRRSVDYSHFDLAQALLTKSLENYQEGDGQGTKLTWIVNGDAEEYDVPAWKYDNEGNGYRNQYQEITPSYIIKACQSAPIHKMVNLNKVLEWIEQKQIQGITLKIKGKRG